MIYDCNMAGGERVNGISRRQEYEVEVGLRDRFDFDIFTPCA
jgi:hypothetical protein